MTNAPGTTDIDTLSFEDALQALQRLVSQMESGDLPLEESVAAFEQGVLLTRHCEQLLDHADKRLQNASQAADPDA